MPPVVNKTMVHPFGAKLSPNCSNFALRETAEDHMNEFNPIISQAVINNFYVDAFLMSVATEQEAIKVIYQMCDLCAKGGFNVTKWTSNSKEIIHTAPVDKRSKEIQKLNLDCADLPMERVSSVS